MRKVFLSLFIAIMFTFSISGCNLISKTTEVATNAATKILYVTVAEVIHILQDEINSIMNKKKIPAKIEIAVKNQKTEQYSDKAVSTADVIFIMKPHKDQILFDPNEYLVEDSDMAKIYVSSVTSFIRILKKHYENQDINIEISGDFEGGADNVRYGQYVGYYGGECGDIRENGVLLNGNTSNIRISDGNKIKNIDLAFLRAYCLFYDFNNRIETIGLNRNSFKDINFIANEYRSEGEKYRYARLKITVTQKK